ncbi:MAG: transposase zinc-binding domain-containing protein, partial [Deltaproteobacteria bacterium]|nr:transposase zinc-binding domain-containing protein [Deltaproteobacteria bacterium]
MSFSCKGRGFCPSCGGRWMCQTAAHLVERVFPEVPVRQWVLTLPMPLRFWLARRPRLCREVLGVFLRAVFGWYSKRARTATLAAGTDREAHRPGARTARAPGALPRGVRTRGVVAPRHRPCPSNARPTVAFDRKARGLHLRAGGPGCSTCCTPSSTTPNPKEDSP